MTTVTYTNLGTADLAHIADRYRDAPDVIRLVQAVRWQARRIEELNRSTRRYHPALYEIATGNLSHNDIERMATAALNGDTP